MSDEKHVPGGRLHRLVKLASVGARAGASALFRSDGEKSAEKAAEVLGQLRGLAAKVGQMASYVDGVVPEVQREAYEKALGSLLTSANASPPEQVRAVVEEDLKSPLAELFSTWEDAPMASASIGQVHRARLHDGREVAVKVQHPGIDAALRSDLQNMGVVESLIATVGGRRFNSDGMLQELRARFLEELDYRLEADRQRHFTKLFADEPRIHIPAVIDDRSTMRVLTTELAGGLGFEAACTAPVTDREAWARTMWRFVFRSVLVHRVFNADPHPGNYLFRPDGNVVFLDFGCAHELAPARFEASRALHRAAFTLDERAFRRAASMMVETDPGPYEDMAVKYIRRCFEPLFARPFRFTRAYSGELVEMLHSLAHAAARLDADEVTPLPENMLFMNRLQFGFYSVLARLDVEVDYVAVEREFFE